jgi:hypothetical protein
MFLGLTLLLEASGDFVRESYLLKRNINADMETPDNFTAGEELILYLTPSNPQPYSVLKDYQSQVQGVDSFVLEDVTFANDRSHEVYGTVPDSITQVPDEGEKLELEPETGRAYHKTSGTVVEAELVFFTSDGIFAHNLTYE